MGGFGKAIDPWARNNIWGTKDWSPKAPKPPGPAPDLTDQVVRAAAEAEAKRLQVGRTRKSTFLGGL